MLAARHDAEVAAQRQHDERQKGLLRALFECVARWLPACGVSVCLCVCVSVFLCVCVSVSVRVLCVCVYACVRVVGWFVFIPDASCWRGGGYVVQVD